MQNRIRYIFFDLGGVFFEWNTYFTNAADTFHIDRLQMAKIFDNYDEQITRGFMTPQKFWEKCQEELHVNNAGNFNFLARWVDDYIPIMSTHIFAKELNRKYKLGIISNTYKGMYPLLIEKNKVPNISFDVKILSCDAGFQKPEREIYRLAQSKTPANNNEILFVDDSDNYLKPAKKMGWQTFLFDTNNVDKSITAIQSMLG